VIRMRDRRQIDLTEPVLPHWCAPCPFCGAARHKRCRTRSGRIRRAHIARLKAIPAEVYRSRVVWAKGIWQAEAIRKKVLEGAECT